MFRLPLNGWFFLYLFLFGCTYTIDEEFYQDIPEFAGSAFISLNEHDAKDTIYLYRATDFEFIVSIDQATIKEVQVMFDDHQIFSSPSPRGKFSLHSNFHLTHGVHTLRIQFISSTQTGSLANKLDAEYIEVWRTWIVNIDLTPPDRPELFLAEENGYQKLLWTPYTKPNFLSYGINIRYCGYSYDVSITDQKRTFLINEYYAGGCNIQYTVWVNNLAGSGSNSIGQTDNFDLTGEYRVADSTMLLTWPKADFPGAFKNYLVHENTVETLNITTASDSSIRFRPKEVIFGLPVSFNVRMYSKSGSGLISNYVNVASLVATPMLLPMPDYFNYNYSENFILGFSGHSGVATVYDLTMQPLRSFATGTNALTIPSRGKYVYFADRERGVVQMDIETGAVDHIDVMRMTTGGVYNSLAIISASANGIVTFKYRAHNSGGYVVYHYCVYDMANKVTIKKAEISSQMTDPVISSDGKYLRYAGNRIYQVNGTSLTLVSELPSNQSFMFFSPDNSEEILTLSGSNHQVYDSQTASLKRSFSTPGFDFYYRGYDPLTKRLLYVKNFAKACVAIDIETLQKTQISAYTGDAANFQLMNGYLLDKKTGDYFKAVHD